MSDRDSASTPPRLATWLLKRLLDDEAFSAIAGDLDEEFLRFIHLALGARRARRWYWGIGSITASLVRPSPSWRPDDPERRFGLAIVQERHGLASDFRSAVRFKGRSRLLSMTIIVTIALGVGATSAVFSVVNALMFKRLPVVHADRVVAIESMDGGTFSYPEYLEARKAAGLDALTASGTIQMTLSAGGIDDLAMVQLVAGNFFDTLGVHAPRLGRLLTPDDDDPSATSAVVLSDALWRDRFGADA